MTKQTLLTISKTALGVAWMSTLHPKKLHLRSKALALRRLTCPSWCFFDICSNGISRNEEGEGREEKPLERWKTTTTRPKMMKERLKVWGRGIYAASHLFLRMNTKCSTCCIPRQDLKSHRGYQVNLVAASPQYAIAICRLPEEGEHMFVPWHLRWLSSRIVEQMNTKSCSPKTLQRLPPRKRLKTFHKTLCNCGQPGLGLYGPRPLLHQLVERDEIWFHYPCVFVSVKCQAI